jgi:hypothetical protein
VRRLIRWVAIELLRLLALPTLVAIIVWLPPHPSLTTNLNHCESDATATVCSGGANCWRESRSEWQLAMTKNRESERRAARWGLVGVVGVLSACVALVRALDGARAALVRLAVAAMRRRRA